MANLEITEAKAAKLNNAEDLALDAITKALKGDTAADDELVKLAAKAVSVVAKNRQTLSHRKAIDFAMASAIGSEKELKAYVAATQPQIRKALAGKTM